MLPTNLGNEFCSLDNAIESLTSPCKNCVDNSFAIIDSNQQADEQQLLELSSVDEGSSTNPRQHTNNAQTDDDSNARHNNSFEVSHERWKNVFNSTITISDPDTHNNQENDNASVDVPDEMTLTPEHYPTFSETKRETEDNELEVVNNSGINTKHSWLSNSDDLDD